MVISTPQPAVARFAGALLVAGLAIGALLIPASGALADERAKEPRAARDAELYFPPPLTIEPLVPPGRPEDELERDPNGLLVLPNLRANATPGSCFENGASNACAQNETAIAVNPTDHDNWVGGANDYSGPIMLDGRAQSSCGFYFSSDAGQTWGSGLLPTQPGYTGGGDPMLAFDGDGNVYYACLNFELTLPGLDLDDTAIFVFKSTNGGASFGAPTEMVSSASLAGTHDKEAIAVGAITDKIYVAWFHSSDIKLAGSDDGAATFDAPAPSDDVQINDAENGSNQGAAIVTVGFPNPEGPDGEAIYVAWLDLEASRILFDKSTDGGASFGIDVVVEGAVVQFPIRQTGTGSGLSDRTTLIGEFGDAADNPESAFRVNSFPSIAACNNPGSPFFGQIYIVFADNRFGDGDIFFKKSEDGGDSFPGTLTRMVNDDGSGTGTDQFFPWVHVDENCKINVLFYDRRDDPANRQFHVYFSHSTDGGASFSPNARVTTFPSTNAQFQGGFIGDYQQVAATVATQTEFHHDLDRAAGLWMDTREGGQDVYTATLLQTQGGTWINVDVDLVASQDATNLEFVFPGDVSDDFSDFYHGSANPFQDHDITFDEANDQTVLAFDEPEPGPLSPGDTAHVGFVLEAAPTVVHSFWTGSGNIGSIPMGTLDFTYDPAARVVTALICNDREDGMALAVSGPRHAVVETPIELEALNATDLPAALAARNASLSPLPALAGIVTPGACAAAPIPGAVRQFEAVLLTATFSFSGGNSRSRAVVFAQKVAKDAREVAGRPDRLYHYAAKLVCGVQPSTTDLRLARGHYATTINLLNLDARPARLEKTLALAIPPGWQQPGEVRTIGRETLPSSRALAVDCDDVRRRVFKGKLPTSFIDGFVTIVSDRSLVVTAVYSTATLNAEGTAEDHSSIHVEPVAERVVRQPKDEKTFADLIVDPELSIDAVCKPRTCKVSVRFTVRNIGDGAAGPFNVQLARGDDGSALADVPVPGGLEPGANFTDTATVQVALNQRPLSRRICIRADAPQNQVPESDETNNERCFDF